MEHVPEEKDSVDPWGEKVKAMDNKSLIEAYKKSKQTDGTDWGEGGSPADEWMMFLRKEMDERGLTQYT